MMIVCIWNTAEMLVTLDQNLLSRVFKEIRLTGDLTQRSILENHT